MIELRADCSRCVGLCCVAPAFTRSADFAISKKAGQPCPHLSGGSRCDIHAHLRDRGFAGCTTFDCFGAGQVVAQRTFPGVHWRDDRRMLDVFGVMRQLHELLWYLTEAQRLRPARALEDALTKTYELTVGSPDDLLALDLGAHWQQVNVLLLDVSATVRADLGGAEHRGADLVGKDLRKARLRGANLRGAYLIGADLTGADLHRADLIGADLRGARLAGADLADALFVTQAQVDAAVGDRTTRLPTGLSTPAHWR